jgi:hypothetical protein
MSAFLNFLNANSGAFNLLFSLVVAAATVFYVVLTRRLAIETERMRLAQTEPHVSVRIEPNPAWINFINLVVENVGAGPAYEVRLSCHPDFEMERGARLSDVGVFAHGIRYLAPGQRVEFFLTSILGDLEEIKKTGGRFDFEVRVQYRGVLGPTHDERFLIDFRHFVGITTLGTPPLEKIARDIEKMRTSIGHLETGWKRLRVDIFSEADRQREEHEREEHVQAMLSAGAATHVSEVIRGPEIIADSKDPAV